MVVVPGLFRLRSRAWLCSAQVKCGSARILPNTGSAVRAMALLLGDLPGVEQVELDSAGDAADAGLAGLAGGKVAGLLGFPRAGPVRAVADGEAGQEDLGRAQPVRTGRSLRDMERGLASSIRFLRRALAAQPLISSRRDDAPCSVRGEPGIESRDQLFLAGASRQANVTPALSDGWRTTDGDRACAAHRAGVQPPRFPR